MNVKVNEKVNDRQKGVSFYVIIAPDTDKFFDDYHQTLFGTAIKWVEHLEGAQRFTGFEAARQVAIALSGSNRIALEVCSVRGVQGQWRVDTESQFFPDSAMSPGLRQGLGRRLAKPPLSNEISLR